MTRPRLLFVNRFAYPDHSATSQILSDLAFDLAGRGRTVRMITSRSLYSDPSARPVARETVKGVSILRVWTLRFGRGTLPGRILDYLSFYPGAFLEILKQARRGDIVVAKTDPPLIGVVAALACAIKGARLVNWLQDLYPEVAAELGITAMRGGIGRAFAGLRNRALNAAAANVVIGERMAARLAAFEIGKVEVIPNWTDDDTVSPVDASALRAEWGFGPADFVVGYSGNLGRAHEADTLLDAARRLAGRPDIRFLFVGGGHGLAGVRAANLPNVSIRAYQPRERLAQSLCAADVHWLSLRPEFEGLVLPSKLYGIAAAGRPILAVCEPQGEISRLVSDHDCGLAVTPGDGEGLARAIEALADDRARCRQMGANARTMLDVGFSKAAAFDRWAALIDRLA